MIRLGLLAGLLIGCNGDKNGDTDEPAATNSCPEGADIVIDSTFPVSGAADFYVRGTIQFTLSDDDPSASLTLKDSGGADVAGTSVVDGDDV